MNGRKSGRKERLQQEEKEDQQAEEVADQKARTVRTP